MMQVLFPLRCAVKSGPEASRLPFDGVEGQRGIDSRVKPKKVLVVDDQQDMADIAVELLRFHGIEGVVAYDALEALKALDVDPEIDAVFSDVMMPGMSGLELAEVVHQRFPQIKVLLTSGFTFPELLVRKKINEILVKPYEIADVIKRLRN